MVTRHKLAILIIVGLILCGLPNAAYGSTGAANLGLAGSQHTLSHDAWLTHTGMAIAVKCPTIYVVRYGETLASIAARCGVSVAALRSVNGLRTFRVWPGQRLYIPTKASSVPAPQPTPSIHRSPAP